MRQVDPLVRAALALLPILRAEVEGLAARATQAESDVRKAKLADAKADARERAIRLRGEADGAQLVLSRLGRIAKG